MKCPKDGNGCTDDLCRGSGCMAMNNYPMLETCPRCGGTVDHENTSLGSCDCDDEYEEWLEDDDEPDPIQEAMDNCGQDADGLCTLAGTEHCDFECPFRG